MEIRRIRADEWRELRELRLRALLDAPDAFTSTYEESAADPKDVWRDWAGGGAEGGEGFTAIAVGEDGWGGMAVGAPHHAFPGEGGLFAMWVDPSVRGGGIAQRLVEEIIEWARTTPFPSIRLRVTTSNGAAIRLYERCGFVDTGERPRCARART